MSTKARVSIGSSEVEQGERTDARPPTSWKRRLGIPKFLLSASIRLWCLRWVVATSAISIYYTSWLLVVVREVLRYNWNVAFAIAMSVITFVHNFGIALGSEYFPMPMWGDILLTAFESGALLYLQAYVIMVKRESAVHFSWFPKRAVFGGVVFWGLTMGVLSALLLKVVELANDVVSSYETARKARAADQLYAGAAPSWKTITTKPVDITRLTKGSLRHKHQRSWYAYTYHVLFGRRPWVKVLPGEGIWIQILRGMATVAIIMTLIVFSTYKMLISPLSEMGMTPNKEYRASFLYTRTFTSSTPIVWNVILLWTPRVGATRNVTDVATVNMIWPSWLDDGTDSRCVPSTPIEVTESQKEAVVFKCARREVPANIHGADIRPQSISPLIHYPFHTRPDLQLSIDFADLDVGSNETESFGRSPAIEASALEVYVALSDDVDALLRVSKPTYLFPGVSAVAVANLLIRGRLEPPELGTLGFESHRTFLTADLIYTSAGTALGATDPNVATMRIGSRFPSEFVIVQDFRDKSILNGFSAIGGLASFLSTILAVVFGANLLQTALRQRLYSPFGLVHQFETEQNDVADECAKRYPGLGEDIKKINDEKQKGILAFLFDTLMDVEPLGTAGKDETLRTAVYTRYVDSDDEE